MAFFLSLPAVFLINIQQLISFACQHALPKPVMWQSEKLAIAIADFAFHYEYGHFF
jgi:hypothetical protein